MRRDRAHTHHTRGASTLEYLLVALLIATALFAAVALLVVSLLG